MKKLMPGDKVKIALKKPQKSIDAVIMSRPYLYSKEILVVKLSNGYNIGIDKKNISNIKAIERYKSYKAEKKSIHQREHLPRVSILHTGGTIASKVDYRTGGVIARFSPEEIIEMFPELVEIVNIQSRLIFQMFSEDIEPEHWGILAKEIYNEIQSGVSAVIVTHGTDTIGYTSSALSFMLRNLPVPVILVGSQRSSDRGSSDAYLNLLSAIRFAINTDFTGVGVCMHGTSSDNYCLVHNGTNVRKLHSSARDAFRSINNMPIAKVFSDGYVEFLTGAYPKADKKELILSNNFEKRTALIKIHPGFNYKEILFFAKNNYKGIVLEGTGMGHAPVSVLDKYTEHHQKLIKTLSKLTKEIVIVMTTQCIYGHVNMNVYSTGRDLLSTKVIPANMLPETAYVKLGWALANSTNIDSAKELFLKNIAGEFQDRLILEKWNL